MTRRPEIAVRLFLLLIEKSIDKGIVPILVLTVAARYGTGPGAAILVAATALAIAATLAAGELSRFVDLRRLLIWSEIGRALGIVAVILGLGQPTGAALTVLAGYALVTLGNGVSAPAGQGMLLEVAASDDDEWVFRWMLWLNNLTFATVPILAALAFVHDRVTLFLGAILGLSLLAMAVLRLGFARPAPPPVLRPWAEFRPFALATGSVEVLRDPTFRLYFLATCILASLNLQPGYYIATLLVQEIDSARIAVLGWSADLTGAEISAYQRSAMTLVVVVFAAALGRFAQRLRPEKRFQIGVPLFALGFALIPILRDPVAILAVSAAVGLAQLIYVPTHSLLVAQLSPPGARARYAAVNELRYRVAALVGAASVAAVGTVPPAAMGALYGIAGLCLLPIYTTILARRAAMRVPEPAE